MTDRPGSTMVRLDPMTEDEFRESFERAVARHAVDFVRRGNWTEAKATEASRFELNSFLPQGRESPHHHFVKVMDESSGCQVGETWYLARPEGGKLKFWVDWLWTEPQHRRQGYATAVLQQLSKEAAKLGADRIGLFVFMDNPNAVALYTKLGFTTMVMGMSKTLK